MSTPFDGRKNGKAGRAVYNSGVPAPIEDPSNPQFTRTQKIIIEVLSDGKPHSKQELMNRCGMDEQYCRTALNFHMTYLRQKIRPLGQDIVCPRLPPGNTIWFQHVRLLNNRE